MKILLNCAWLANRKGYTSSFGIAMSSNTYADYASNLLIGVVVLILEFVVREVNGGVYKLHTISLSMSVPFLMSL